MTTDHRINTYFFIVLLVGISLRLIMPLRGYNFDVQSYRIVAYIVAHGGNVYAETARYNYGPIWFSILHALDVIPWHSANKTIELHWKVASFLTMVDVGIFLIFFKVYGAKIATLFFLNPISIIITGYHSQFDNLSIFLGLIAVAILSSRKNTIYVWTGLIVMGLSLSVKHILFFFPLWLAFKEDHWSSKILFVMLPYTIFFCGFLFFLPAGWNGILKNVFLYRSFNNAPFWVIFTPYLFYSNIVPAFVLFLLSLLMLGLYWRPKNILDSFQLYLISVVVFSSAIANQYLAICTPAIATQWNSAYAGYTLLGFIYLLITGAGLHISYIGKLLSWNGGYAYYFLIALLSLGLLINSVGLLELIRYIKSFFSWLSEQILNQLKVPW